MVNRFYSSCLAALTIGLLFGTCPANAQIPTIHIDNITPSTVTGAINAYTANVMKANELITNGQKLISNGVSGLLDTAMTSVTGAISDGLNTAKDAVGLGEDGALTNAISEAGTTLSSAGNAVKTGLNNTAERLGDMVDVSAADDLLENIPGGTFVSGLTNKASSITGVIGNWAEDATPRVGLTATTGTQTSDADTLLRTFTPTSSGDEGVTITDVHGLRSTFNAMVGDISTTVISTSAAAIQNVTDYDKTVDPSAQDATPNTTLEIAQQSNDMREDLKNWNGTTATWLAMSNAALTMDIERIALEAGTVLQDSVSSTQSVSDLLGFGGDNLFGLNPGDS